MTAALVLGALLAAVGCVGLGWHLADPRARRQRRSYERDLRLIDLVANAVRAELEQHEQRKRKHR